MDDTRRLQLLLRARHPLIWITTSDEPCTLALVREAVFDAGLSAWHWSATLGVSDALVASTPAIENTEHPAAACIAMRLASGTRPHAAILAEPSGFLEDARTLRSLRDLVESLAAYGGSVIVVEHSAPPPPALADLATRFEPSLPSEAALEEIVRASLRDMNDRRSIKVDIPKRSYRSLVRNLRGLSARHAALVIRDAVADDDAFTAEDLPRVVARKRELVGSGGVLEFVEAVRSLDEVGGLERLKAWLGERERAFDDDAASFGISPPRGVLMLGVQGAGKSLSAKAIAAGWQRPLLRLDPSSLYDKYIGESEATLRKALRQAEMMAPIVLWIDEIEKGFASAASSSNDGGLSRRMFGTLLTWMQEHKAPVFLVATANDIEALPPELLRKGRFDEIFFVDLPGERAREAIWRVHLARRRREPLEFDLPVLVRASDGRSGAEIEQALVSALTSAFAAGRELSTEALVAAVEQSPPLSVVMAEKIAKLRSWAKDRCVPAD